MVLKHPSQKKQHIITYITCRISININIKLIKEKYERINTHIDAMKQVEHLLFIKQKC